MMQEKGAFQRGKASSSAKPRPWSATDLRRNLELYFQCCSIEMTCTQMAKVGGTLANGGMCPFTKDPIFNSDSVKNVLSLMHSCGMYDYSGEWSYLVGIPAKSGVSGVIYGVIPNVMSIAVYSPRLDKIGNSVRGVEFFKRFIKRFNFHVFDSLMVSNDKKTITKFAHQGDFNTFLLEVA
uniref:glutaminase n=1 Tax=Arcella intermedia TaxID=1963864 RepID=A0A6B2LIJ2_9EUKA